MFLIETWEKISEENKLLIKKFTLASLGIYILLQLIGFLFPIVVTVGVGFWAYKNYIEPNPRILK